MSWSGIILILVGALLLANNFDMLPPDRARRRSRDDDAIDRPRRDVDPRP